MAFETIGVRAVIEGLAAFERASRVIKKELVDIIDKEKELERQNEQVRKTMRNMGLALVGAAAAGGAFLFSATRLAARVETLGVVTAQLGKNVGLTEKEVRALEKSIKAQGITLRSTRAAIALMVQANIDLAKGTELARLAQDAAVIANINSSEAFERLIFVISSGNLRMARTLGLQVSFQQAYKDTAEAVGKAVSELTQQEKIQARTNVVLEAGTRIAGTYAAAMETAGKKVLSLDRHLEESRRILGEVFLPIFADVVDAVTGGLKAFQNLDTAQQKQLSTGIAMATLWSGIGGAALLLFANIGKLQSAFQSLALVMSSSFGPIILLLGFLAATTTAIALQNAKLKENRRQFDKLERAAQQASTTYEGYVKETIALAEETGKVVKTQEELNDLLPVVRQRLLDSGRVIVLASEATFNATTAYEKYVDAVEEAAEETDVLVVTQEQLAKLTDRARSRLFAFNNAVVLLTVSEFRLNEIGKGLNDEIRQKTKAFEEAEEAAEDLTLSEAELEAQEKALEEQQKRLQGELSKLKDLMKEDITEGFIEWKEKTEELTATIEELEKKRYLTDDQKEELEETRGQLAKTTEAWREHTANVIFNLAEQALAIDGLTEEEILALAKLQEKLGLVDEGFAALTGAVLGAGGQMDAAGDQSDNYVEDLFNLNETLNNATTSAWDLEEAIGALPSEKTIRIRVILSDVPTDIPKPSPTIPKLPGPTPQPPKLPPEFQRGGFAQAGKAALVGGKGGLELFVPRVSGTILSNQFVNALGNLAHALTALPAMSAPMPMMAPAIAGSTNTNNLTMNIQTSAPREPIISDFATLEGLANAL